MTTRFKHLLARMSALENSVEAEHETSLDLLDVLLMKKQKQPPVTHSNADLHSAGHHGSSRGGGGGNGGGGAGRSPSNGVYQSRSPQQGSSHSGGRKTSNVVRRSR